MCLNLLVGTITGIASVFMLIGFSSNELEANNFNLSLFTVCNLVCGVSAGYVMGKMDG